MKAIEIKSDLKFVFLDAVKACGLEVEELKKCKFPGKVFSWLQSAIYQWMICLNLVELMRGWWLQNNPSELKIFLSFSRLT